MKSELQKELDRFKELKNKAEGDTGWIDKTIEDLEDKLGVKTVNTQEQRQAMENQMFDELKVIVETANLNEVLGHPEANKIVHKLLYDQRVLHLDELDKHEAASREQISEILADNLRLTTEIEEARKDARFQLNESVRLKQQVESLQDQLEAEKERRTQYSPSESLQEMLEEAKTVTEQRKIKITNVQPVNEKETHFTADSETGEKLTIPHYALKAYEQVDRLSMPSDVTDDEIEEQMKTVEEAAAEADQFQDVVPGDGSGSAAQDGAEKALEDVSEPHPQTLADRVAELEQQVARLNKRVFPPLPEGQAYNV